MKENGMGKGRSTSVPVTPIGGDNSEGTNISLEIEAHWDFVHLVDILCIKLSCMVYLKAFDLSHTSHFLFISTF